MHPRTRHAIARRPGPNLVDGLTTVDLGRPDWTLALAQHGLYCAALESCGVRVQVLDADPLHADATFVEDTAVLANSRALLSRPGAESRRGEVDGIASALSAHFASIARIDEPGTLDGGDVCETGSRWLIGVSARTNADGAAQLARWLAQQGIESTAIDIRGVEGILHFKSAVCWLGDDVLAATEPLASHAALADFEVLRVPAGEAYAANLVRVNDRVLVARGFPTVERDLRARGFDTLALDMSEFQRVDGGLSCLSLRF
jgi:dimethylargininase